MTKPAPRMSATEIAADLVEKWHQEHFGLRIADWKLGELTRRIASAIVGPSNESIREKVCLAYQGDTIPCATPCLHCDRIARALTDTNELERLRALNAEMLAALQRLLRVYTEEMDTWDSDRIEEVISARAVIAKALRSRRMRSDGL